MNIEEAKIGMRVLSKDDSENEAVITNIDNLYGCEFLFKNGDYKWEDAENLYESI